MWVHSTQFGNQLLGLHWSSSFEIVDQVFGFYCKGCQGCTYWTCLDFVTKDRQGYLQEFRTLDVVKHGSIGDVTDNGSQGEENGEIAYRR